MANQSTMQPQYTPMKAGITQNGYVSTNKGTWVPVGGMSKLPTSTPSNNYSGNYQASAPQEQGYSVTDYFGGKDTEGYKKYKEGKAQGKWGDLQEYVNKGGTAQGAGGASGSFVDNLMDSIKKDVERQTSFLDKYTKNNPFAFDEALAKQSATAEYSPYYTELLDDYIKGVDLKRQTIEDDKKLQTELNKYQDEQTSRDFSKALSQVEEGYAGKGLLFSGLKARSEGELGVEKVTGQERTGAVRENQQASFQRQDQAINQDLSNYQRDVGREQEAAIEGGIQQRYGEAQTQYNTPLIQSYNRQFGGGNLLQGYLVPDFLRY